jgi:two-component system, OmpR family, sensor kinase
MRLRTRLVLAFLYILLTVIIALGVPLAWTLQNRARSEFRTNLLVTAQVFAASLSTGSLEPQVRSDLNEDVEALSRELTPSARIIVVNRGGHLMADSCPRRSSVAPCGGVDGRSDLGEPYATAGRQELVQALNRVPNSAIRFSNDLNEDIVVAAAPIFDETTTGTAGGSTRTVVAGAVRISESLAQVNQSVRRSTIGLLVIGLAGLVAGLVLAFGIAASIARPLHTLTSTARRLGDGDLGARTDNIGGAEEIREVGQSFDDMADRLERTVQAQREFVANASHQLRTPLTGVKLRLESVIDANDDPSSRADLQAAEHEVDRLSEIISRLLLMSRQIEAGDVTRVDLADAAHRAVERWQDRAEHAGATLRVDGEDGVAQANPTDVDQMLDNLLDNAIAYAPGPIKIQTGRRDGSVVFAVEDLGPGIPPEEIPRVTERFYRGVGVRSGGSGLGLAIANELAEKWGGTTSVLTGEGGGVRVEIELRAAGPGGTRLGALEWEHPR